MIMKTITSIIFPLLDDGFHVPKPNKNLLELVKVFHKKTINVSERTVKGES